MASVQPRRHGDVESCVEDILRTVGRHVVLGVPLGIGKPSHIVNELYRRAERDPSIRLEIHTALTLRRLPWSSELERRLVEPINERLFGDCPELAYAEPYARGALPDNVKVTEFYLAPGALVDSDAAQQSYVSLNYSHAVAHALDVGVNVFAQLVSPDAGELSLSCNSDLGVELIPRLRAAARRGARVAVCAQVNPRLPFLPGPAAVEDTQFDIVLDAPAYEHELPSVPHDVIDAQDHWIGLHASSLVRDGGTIQLGIGALGDAVTHALIVRHREPGLYAAILHGTATAGVSEPIGGVGAFDRGLYAASEMLVDGVLQLHREGILRRRVYDCAPLQRLLDDGAVSERVDRRTFELLRDAGVRDPALLQRLGVLRRRFADLDAVTDDDLGDRLRGGVLAHAAFFLGPRSMYRALLDLTPEERAELHMSSICFVNELYRDYELKCAQRRHARFINTGMIATAMGAVASDGLDDGRVVSGVGGQYNFVAMAHALPEARSILLVRAVRGRDGEPESNIRYSYGHTTIPRHLRDVVVTEYGVADLRGKSDSQVIARMIEIADSRFQAELVRQAQAAGKLPADFRVRDRFRANVPERLEQELVPLRRGTRFCALPFGSEVTEEERTLARALRRLRDKPRPRFETVAKSLTTPEAAAPYLARLRLDEPSGIRQRLMRSAVLYALSSDHVI